MIAASSATEQALLPLRRWTGRCVGPVVFALAVVAMWETWVRVADVATIVAPSPFTVLADIVGHPDAYLPATLSTLRTTVLGLLVGMATGVALATLSWWSPLLGGVVGPTAVFVRSAPAIALIPLFARVFGYGAATVVATCALLVFFPAFVIVGSGLRAVPAASPDLITAFGGRRRDLLWRVALPAALPSMATALRVSASVAVLVALTAEYLTGTDGLGAEFVRLRFDFSNVGRAWGVALVASALSACAFLSTTALERVVRARFT